MKFVAVDVETANPDLASICSIGAATFENGTLVSEWYTLVDPRDYFYQVNVAIHGIDEDMVRGAPTYEEVTARIDQLFRDMVVVSHTHFDRVAIRQASERRSVERPRCRWLDSAMVARRTWKECARSGYGLADVCNRIGYEFQHHNALEDAKAAGHVLMAAMAKTGLDLDGMLQRVLKPIAKPSGPKARPSGPRATVKREGNPDGPFSRRSDRVHWHTEHTAP